MPHDLAINDSADFDQSQAVIDSVERGFEEHACSPLPDDDLPEGRDSKFNI